MHSSAKTLLFKIFLIISFSCWNSNSLAFIASDMRVIVVSPFTYSEDGMPQNAKEEMAIDVDLPQAIADYFLKVNAFKSVSISKFEASEKNEADLFVHGEILDVNGGSGTERAFGGSGRASILIGIKVFDVRGNLLHEGRVTQNGGVTNIYTSWSNKRNISSAMKALPKKVLPVAIGGDLTTPEGVIRAVESKNTLAIRAAAMSSHAHKLFKNRTVIDAMESFVLQAITNSNNDRYLIDSIAWCLRNIGESGDNKYSSSLDKVIKSNAHKKIKKYAENALIAITQANK